MLFEEEVNFANLIKECVSDPFLQEVADKYHYLKKDLPELKKVAQAMQKSMTAEAAFGCRQEKGAEKHNPCCSVVMTLGEGVDQLQDSYTERALLTESYMVEAMGGEILLKSYMLFNKWIEKNTVYHVAKYFFPGSERECPIEELPKVLTEVSLPVRCNESYYLIPKKSVAFYALLTKEEGVRCVGICENCGRRDCQNRSHAEKLLPYGYARILGRVYL